MICLYPIRPSRYNVDVHHSITVGCGRCIACRLNHARDWSIRIMHAASKHEKNCFMTLTYSDENLPNTVFVRELQLFFKRMRKAGHTFQYYACGEYGERTLRPHYHVAFIGYCPDGKPGYVDLPQWPYGQVHFGDLTPDSAQYVAGYHLKKTIGKDVLNLPSSPFSIMSRRPGIGDIEKVKNKSFVWHKGNKVSLPRYYANKFEKLSSLSRDTIGNKILQLDEDKHLDLVNRFMLNYKKKGGKL